MRFGRLGTEKQMWGRVGIGAGRLQESKKSRNKKKKYIVI